MLTTAFSQTKDQEAASEKMVKKISKECPGCKRRIQKAGGCEHMQCTYPFTIHSGATFQQI
jgi:hypothetical protein